MLRAFYQISKNHILHSMFVFFFHEKIVPITTQATQKIRMEESTAKETFLSIARSKLRSTEDQSKIHSSDITFKTKWNTSLTESTMDSWKSLRGSLIPSVNMTLHHTTTPTRRTFQTISLTTRSCAWNTSSWKLRNLIKSESSIAANAKLPAVLWWSQRALERCLWINRSFIIISLIPTTEMLHSNLSSFLVSTASMILTTMSEVVVLWHNLMLARWD